MTMKFQQNANIAKPRYLPKEEDGYTVFDIGEGDFRILQLTDAHIGAGLFSAKKDELAFEAIKKAISDAQPDLIIFTGDNVYPIFVFSGSTDNLKQTKKFSEFVESFHVPWACVFGNHDEEKHSRYKKERLADYFETLPYCLFKKGDEDVSGCGNYVIKVKGKNGIAKALMLLDSHSYVGKGFTSGFDVIHDDQISWYEKEINQMTPEGGEKVKSLAFFHIPPEEFKEAWIKLTLGDKSVEYHHGFVQEKDNYFGYSKHLHGNFFEEMVKFGSCEGMFMGHDHLSTLSLTYKGIRLTYGMSIDYLAYIGIKKRVTQRGGTLITVNADGSWDTKPLPFDARQKGKRER